MIDHETLKIFRDRDVFHDVLGNVYVTLGHIQPKNRVISLLKYVPDTSGKWQCGSIRYRRVFSGGVCSASESMNIAPQEYLIFDNHLGSTILEVPRTDIVKYFSPEHRLREIIENGPKDSLEESVKQMAETLHDTLGIPLSNLGVTGSIAWNAHDVRWSDINMNIYGFDTSWQLQDGYTKVAEENKHMRLTVLSDWKRSMSNITKRIPSLTSEDLKSLFSRRTELYCNSQYIGLMPVLTPTEVLISHGSEEYVTMSMEPISIIMNIDNIDYGIFMPAIYLGQSEPIKSLGDTCVTRIMMYAGAFRGMIQSGDRVEVSGTLQKVILKNKISTKSSSMDAFYQIMVGTRTGIGKEFIRIIRNTN